MGKTSSIIPNIVREGTKFDVSYVRENNLLKDFSLLTIDVARILNIKRENVQVYILPQLDYIQADKELKIELNQKRITNLISKESLNDYIRKALIVGKKSMPINISKSTSIKKINMLFQIIPKNQLQGYIDVAVEDFNRDCQNRKIDLPNKYMIKFDINKIDFVEDVDLWSLGMFLEHVIDYPNQMYRILKRTRHIKVQLPITLSTSNKKNDKGVRYILPNKETIAKLKKRTSGGNKLNFELSYESFNYINSLLYQRSNKIKYNDYRDTYAIDTMFNKILIDELYDYILDRYKLDEKIKLDSK